MGFIWLRFFSFVLPSPSPACILLVSGYAATAAKYHLKAKYYYRFAKLPQTIARRSSEQPGHCNPRSRACIFIFPGIFTLKQWCIRIKVRSLACLPGEQAVLRAQPQPAQAPALTLQKHWRKKLLEWAMLLRCGSSVGGTWKLMLHCDTRGHCKPGSFGFRVGRSKNWSVCYLRSLKLSWYLVQN